MSSQPLQRGLPWGNLLMWPFLLSSTEKSPEQQYPLGHLIVSSSSAPPSVWAEVRSLEELSAFWPRVPAPGSGDAGCSRAMKPPPAKVAASMMQFTPGLSWGNGHSTVQCCSLALTQPPENTGSSQGRAPSHQQNTHHRGGSHNSVHP